ncbi:Alpha/Beta hydrolase protein [Pisolithus orientalis]|uniref:Alpha/Beta hydrolase protein n=2 Tax=Pisolithus orientalis TaxID=936130 RepID=UPI0022240151|nr:Alpha/Beta hydrolase protein [Pisolithus orientalis]XP_051596373.1 Alpha/Beta hydrolase protein [Pisolithus orientalis]KAI5995744.1 Alpha/Beta hydrolase protein [Pisolithus orientalis]KAI5995745.1 Alpha/Beta hydrolase protein [Pisolithus orientalis]
MPYISTDNYIVLCHGFVGTDSMMGLSYFNGVKDDLTSRGCKVIVPKVSMTGSIDERAKQLDLQIEDLLNLRSSSAKPGLHLICHSMGGLDARRLVHFSGLRYNVLSITTVSTPHYGSPIASLSESLGFVSRLSCQLLLSCLSGSGKAMNDMTPEHMENFNARYKNVPGIKYYSVTSKFQPFVNHIFYISNKFIKKGSSSKYPKAFGENDGMVAVNSAKWGEFLGVVSDETSHFGIIGWGIMGILAGDSNYDAKDMYRWLVDNVARKVEGKAE